MSNNVGRIWVGFAMSNKRRAIIYGFAIAILLPLSPTATDLPPSIQVDRLLVQSERETRDGNHWSAAYTLERVLDLYEENAMDIPLAFWFQQARTFGSAGMNERAVGAATRYLQEAGQEGEHYREALKILDVAEAALDEARRAEARVRAAADQAERDAAARVAAIEAGLPEMVSVPAGRGVRTFELSKYEVTFAQWDVCTKFGPCRWVSDEGWGRGDRPVVNVSWPDAQTYVEWLSLETHGPYRLPSEEEWRHAALAGSTTRYSWGRQVGRSNANCAGCGSQWDNDRTAPVGSFPANAFGLHDMHGNVWEWVQNCWRYSGMVFTNSCVVQIGSDRGDDCDVRVRRGGSWASKPKYLRVVDRCDGFSVANHPRGDVRFNHTGFRVARTVDR